MKRLQAEPVDDPVPLMTTGEGLMSFTGNRSIGDVTAASLPEVNAEAHVRLVSILRKVNFWYLIVLIVIGLLGNSLSIATICRSKLKRISSNHFLIALTCSDSVFLLSLLLIWLSKCGLPVYHREGPCQLVLFCLNCSSWLSSWYFMVLTIERYFVVYFPLSQAARCTIGRTRRIICMAIPMPLLFNVWVFVATGVTDSGFCDTKKSYYHTAMILNWLDTLLSFVLPALVVITCNIAICVRLFSRRDVFATLQGGSAERTRDGAAPLMRCHNPTQKRQTQERKVTQSLVTLSFIFVALNVPSYALRLRDYILVATDRIPQEQDFVDIILENVFNLIYYSNFAINFFLYCLTSRNFRNTVVALWRQEVKSMTAPKMLYRLTRRCKTGGSRQAASSVSLSASEQLPSHERANHSTCTWLVAEP
uniref:G_PROTEIN_RECEP_F1_2 domain-containing protein n=1 Tax=Trichuris muris TaxID=70415 RepID=A0A5S6R349_TRIMR